MANAQAVRPPHSQAPTQLAELQPKVLPAPLTLLVTDGLLQLPLALQQEYCGAKDERFFSEDTLQYECCRKFS